MCHPKCVFSVRRLCGNGEASWAAVLRAGAGGRWSFPQGETHGVKIWDETHIETPWKHPSSSWFQDMIFLRMILFRSDFKYMKETRFLILVLQLRSQHFAFCSIFVQVHWMSMWHTHGMTSCNSTGVNWESKYHESRNTTCKKLQQGV